MTQNNDNIPACGLVVFEGRHAPGSSDQLTDACSQICLIITGHARWECGGRRYLLGPDTLCHIPAGQTYRQETLPETPVLAYVIRYRPELPSPAISNQLKALGMVPLDLSTTNINQAKVVRSIFQEMLFEQNACQEGWETILQSRLMDLGVRVLRLIRGRGRQDLPVFEPGNDSTDRVARYAMRLKSQFFRQETIEEAARSVGLSRRQFTELFRKVTGQSWRQYVLGLRLRHAAGLLVDTERSVVAVAFETGFNDLSHFHHSFKSAYGCSPLAYREQRRVRLPSRSRSDPEAEMAGATEGYRFRGIKGWFWTPEQYQEEIKVLADLKMNFLMDCDGMISRGENDAPLNHEWLKPLKETQKNAYLGVFNACRKNAITFCFALQPQLSTQPIEQGKGKKFEAFCQNYLWAQQQEMKWFGLCLDGTSWGSAGPAAGGLSHAALVNAVFNRLQMEDPRAQFLFCPVACWGDGTNPEHHAYLQGLARAMHPDVIVFWNGDGVVTPRITRVAAESYKQVVKHRLFLWDNYPVNDGSQTLHLGPVSGRDPDLCELMEGYLSNPMYPQSQINRIPLATCADYASNPKQYNPARSIGHAILRFAKTTAQQQVLKQLVEAYPGFIVAGGGTGTNPVRQRFGSIIASQGPDSVARDYISQLAQINVGLQKQFPHQFSATRKTLAVDIAWMNEQIL